MPIGIINGLLHFDLETARLFANDTTKKRNCIVNKLDAKDMIHSLMLSRKRCVLPVRHKSCRMRHY